MTLDMVFLRRRSTSTLAAVRSPSAMLEPLLVVAFPVPDIRKSLVTRRPPGGDGHNAEAVLGPEVVDDEPHGLLQERELCPGHAAADVQHCHEVERRVAGRRFAIRHPASLDVHEDGEIVARRMYEPLATLDS